jgi:hypothetical protein
VIASTLVHVVIAGLSNRLLFWVCNLPFVATTDSERPNLNLILLLFFPPLAEFSFLCTPQLISFLRAQAKTIHQPKAERRQ